MVRGPVPPRRVPHDRTPLSRSGRPSTSGVPRHRPGRDARAIGAAAHEAGPGWPTTDECLPAHGAYSCDCDTKAPTTTGGSGRSSAEKASPWLAGASVTTKDAEGEVHVTSSRRRRAARRRAPRERPWRASSSLIVIVARRAASRLRRPPRLGACRRSDTTRARPASTRRGGARHDRRLAPGRAQRRAAAPRRAARREGAARVTGPRPSSRSLPSCQVRGPDVTTDMDRGTAWTGWASCHSVGRQNLDTGGHNGAERAHRGVRGAAPGRARLTGRSRQALRSGLQGRHRVEEEGAAICSRRGSSSWPSTRHAWPLRTLTACSLSCRRWMRAARTGRSAT